MHSLTVFDSATGSHGCSTDSLSNTSNLSISKESWVSSSQTSQSQDVFQVLTTARTGKGKYIYEGRGRNRDPSWSSLNICIVFVGVIDFNVLH